MVNRASYHYGLGSSFQSLRTWIERRSGGSRIGSGRMSDAFRTGKKGTANKPSLLQDLAGSCPTSCEERSGRDNLSDRDTRLCGRDACHSTAGLVAISSTGHRTALPAHVC